MFALPVESVGSMQTKASLVEHHVSFSFCLGCSFESNDKEFLHIDGNIAIEWESSAYYLRYLSGREQVRCSLVSV